MLKQRVLSLLIACAVSTSALAAPASTPPIDSTPASPAAPSRAGDQVLTGVIGALLLWGLVSALSADSGNKDAPRETWRYRQRDGGSSSSPGAGPDTSAGCAWGDRSYGTCH